RVDPRSGLGRRRPPFAHFNRTLYRHSFLGGDGPDYVAIEAVCVDRLARFDQPNQSAASVPTLRLLLPASGAGRGEDKWILHERPPCNRPCRISRRALRFWFAQAR